VTVCGKVLGTFDKEMPGTVKSGSKEKNIQKSFSSAEGIFLCKDGKKDEGGKKDGNKRGHDHQIGLIEGDKERIENGGTGSYDPGIEPFFCHIPCKGIADEFKYHKITE
jgi:hypothetical protein